MGKFFLQKKIWIVLVGIIGIIILGKNYIAKFPLGEIATSTPPIVIPIVERNKISLSTSEIAKIGSVAKTKRTDGFEGYIEILNINPYKTPLGRDGIEVYARAWDKNDNRIGFGKDGTVDIEHFIFVNFSITTINPLDSEIENAVLNALSETIKIKKEKFDGSHIKFGKIGSTTLTSYPDTGNPGSVTVDGWMNYGDGDNPNTYSVGWATMHNASAGQETGPYGTATQSQIKIRSRTITNEWEWLYRGFMTFDTSSITSGGTISSATTSLYGASTIDELSLSATYNMNIYGATLAADNTITLGDFDQVNVATSSTAINYSSYSTVGYNNFALNAGALAVIDKIGVTQYSVRDTNYDANNTAPAWGNTLRTGLSWWTADDDGTAVCGSATCRDPKLVVEYTAAAIPTVKGVRNRIFVE